MNKNSLHNIATGQAISPQVCEFLTNIEQKGDEQRKKFIKECSEDKDRFEKPIKRNVLYTFSSTVPKHKIINTKDGKITKLKSQRDLFATLLAICIQYKVDLSTVMSYPITHVPFSLFHTDGTMNKTDKSILMKYLETKVPTTQSLSHNDVVIYDGFALLHQLQNLPFTYGEISEKILHLLVADKNVMRIDLIFDTYRSPSLKDHEHKLRKCFSKPCNITYRKQLRSNDFHHDLKNNKFKDSFVKFLMND